MMAKRIERVDTIPLIHAMLVRMRVEEVIDKIFVPHANWSGLSYGQLSVLYLTYVLHSLTHRLSSVESWVKEHKTVIEQVTGWKLTEKDATNDRLCRLVEVLGHDMKMIYDFQLQMSQHLIAHTICPQMSHDTIPPALVYGISKRTQKTTFWHWGTARIIDRISFNTNRA